MDLSALPDPVIHPNALKVLNKQNYCWPRPDGTRETPREMFERVAKFVASAESIWGGDPQIEATKIYMAMVEGKFIFNTPTMVNAGKPNGQLAACFVEPISDSTDAIYETLKATALIQTSGGGTGMSGARLRCKGSLVGTTGKVSGGAMSTLKLFNASSKEFITQGSARRGANMWIHPVWHADIEEFVDMKIRDGELSEFNVSVGITDDFMRAVQNHGQWYLYDPKGVTDDEWMRLPMEAIFAKMKIVKSINAYNLWRKITHNAWKFGGEPGVFFIDTVNAANPTPNVGRFEACNPCAEQTLLAWEACTLGHVNLARFWQGNEWEQPFDFDGMNEMFENAVRWLDNVVELNSYPLPQIEQMHKYGNRKIGVGVLGFGNLLAKAHIPYDSDQARKMAVRIASAMELYTDRESVLLAQQRGAFNNFKGSALEGKFPDGIRNANRRTVAPTGSTAIIIPSEPESTGIEPIFGLVQSRNQAGMQMYDVNYVFNQALQDEMLTANQRQLVLDYVSEHGTLQGCDIVPEWMWEVYKQANDISPAGHVLMQAAWQKYVDNAISKTINFSQGATYEDVEKAYWLAWETKCKGITVYVDGSRKGQPLTVGQKTDVTIQEIDPKHEIVSKFKQLNGHTLDVAKEIVALLTPEQIAQLGLQQVTIDVPASKLGRDRSHVTQGTGRKMETGCGNAFIFLGQNADGGLDDVVGRLGKSGGCASAFWEGLSRVTSIALRHGVSIDEIRKQLTGISCHRPAFHHTPGQEKPDTITSCADGLATALYEFQLEQTKANQTMPPAALIEAKAVGGDQIEARATQPIHAIMHIGACPSCYGNQLDYGSGCALCRSCGWSQC